jgi:DNA (cytosine-5)-methyltransferase 1
VSAPLVLSLFPGIGLLDMAFEEEGFCVVRGPDLLWGGDVRRFHPPSGKFDGVIGGPPCQRWSRLANIVRAVHGEASVAPDLIPEYERCVAGAAPSWFLMENVPGAPEPDVMGYRVRSVELNNRMFGGAQNRDRRFSFGTPDGRALSASAIAASIASIHGEWEPAVCSTAGGRRASVAMVRGPDGKPTPKGNQGRSESARLRKRTFAEECELQGLPRDFLADSPFTVEGKREVVGNGVPLPMGRAVARAVKRAMGYELTEGVA